MWIDTHCHLDAPEFDADRDAVVARARAAGVSMAILATGAVSHFEQASRMARLYRYAYGLGIHPLWVNQSIEDDIERLRAALAAGLADERLVAVGEIGVDLFVEGIPPARQEWFFREQLKLARDFGLPVIVHVRRSADVLLKHLRRIEVPGGVIHAFNGSREQAEAFIARGFRLGFGGAMTYAGSQRIRRHAAELPEHAWVLETDSPDIAPAWLRVGGVAQRNEPAELPRIAQTLADLRGLTLSGVAAINRRNAVAALPRLAPLLEAD
ncbi:MAG: TatD family hydrolase [Burkholderiaceae bacterium]